MALLKSKVKVEAKKHLATVIKDISDINADEQAIELKSVELTEEEKEKQKSLFDRIGGRVGEIVEIAEKIERSGINNIQQKKNTFFNEDYLIKFIEEAVKKQIKITISSLNLDKKEKKDE